MSLDFDVSIESEAEEHPFEDEDTVKNIKGVFKQQVNRFVSNFVLFFTFLLFLVSIELRRICKFEEKVH